MTACEAGKALYSALLLTRTLSKFEFFVLWKGDLDFCVRGSPWRKETWPTEQIQEFLCVGVCRAGARVADWGL